MENATKALLIAASILIVIVLIAVSLKMLAPASDTAEEVGKVSSTLGISIFNSQFEKYEGVKSGAEVKSLLSIVMTTWKSDSKHHVAVSYGAKTYETYEGIRTVMFNMDSTKTYNVLIADRDENGYISEINIS